MGIDLTELIRTIGYVGLFGIIFAESGLFFGFFLPGDSLLFTAGFLASQDILSLPILLPLVIVGAVLGDQVGYWMGNKFGDWLLAKEDSFFFKRKHLDRASDYYEKNGGRTLILARFIPVVRTFVPIVAGMAKMQYRTFFSFNVIGGVLWAAGMVIAGYYLGQIIPGVDKYLLPIVFVIIVVSVLPGLWHMRAELLEAARNNPLTRRVRGPRTDQRA